MKISYGITVHNEAEELEKLLGKLLVSIDEQDEVVICVDGDDENVKGIIKLYSIDSRVIHYNRKLDGNFSDQKNSVIEKSSGDYVFHIDADEYPNKILIQQLKQILEMNDVDLVWLPRVNTVDGMTQEHIQKWGWNVNEKGWINFPDLQWRIYKNNSKIKWKNKVHEVLEGYDKYSELPNNEELCLTHKKTIKKQEKQNNYYATL